MCLFNLSVVRSRLSDSISFLMFCLVFFFLEIFFVLFEIDVKLRHGLMRCRSEISLLMFVFCFFGVDVKLRHGLMRCRSEFHSIC
jgi:hypothetical protein